jgi:hypothetical protein
MQARGRCESSGPFCLWGLPEMGSSWISVIHAVSEGWTWRSLLLFAA